MNNTIRPRSRCQDFYNKDSLVSPQFIADPVQFVKGHSVIGIGILNQLISMHRKYRGKIFILQSTLASMFGISREWANKLLRSWEEAGLVMRDYRHMKINFYRVSPILFKEPNRNLLISLLPALRAISLALILSNPLAAGVFHASFTQHINTVIRNYKTYVNSHTIAKERLAMKFIREWEGNKPVSRITMQLSDKIGLTALGQVKLSCYPDEAIEHAYQELRNSRKPIFDEFKYLCKLAHSYCDQTGIVPDWQYVTDTMLLLKINPSAPTIDRSLITKEEPLPDAFEDRKPAVSYKKTTPPAVIRKIPLYRDEKPMHPKERAAFLRSEIKTWHKNVAYALDKKDGFMMDLFMDMAHKRLKECQEELDELEPPQLSIIAIKDEL